MFILVDFFFFLPAKLKWNNKGYNILELDEKKEKLNTLYYRHPR